MKILAYIGARASAEALFEVFGEACTDGPRRVLQKVLLVKHAVVSPESL